MLTKEQKKRLAKEARKLAMECVNGGDEGLDGYSYAHCALGELSFRVNGHRSHSETIQLAAALPVAEQYTVQVALYAHYRQPGSVVFPLLALADALNEDAA